MSQLDMNWTAKRIYAEQRSPKVQSIMKQLRECGFQR